ncbi:MAG TPA: hypothetical protein PK239_06065 [Chitinophagales bacterium]|nr:hypothetical protein [Chitinophagales bacterium]
MRNIIALFFICWLTALHFQAIWAQPANQEGGQEIAPENIDIIKPYEPVLADAVKVDFNPDLPTREELEKSKPKFGDYQVPNRFLTLNYEPLPLKPLAYKPPTKKEKDTEDLYNVWLRGGYGNLNTPFFDASVSAGRSERFMGGLNGSYISSQGLLELQDYARTNMRGFGKYFTKSNFIGAEAGFNRQKYYFYGFNADTLLMPPPSDAESAKQLFQTISGSLEFGNSIENKAETDYNLKTTYHRFTDNFNAAENNLLINGNVTKLFNEHISATGLLHTHYSNYTADTTTVNNLLLNFIPSFVYRSAFATLSVGANAMLNHNKFYAYPYLTLSAFPIEDKVEIYGIWKKELVKNNYMSLSAANPFVQQLQEFQNARLEERNVGVKGNVGLFGFDLKGGQNITTNQPLFVNDSTDLRRFNVVYDKLTTWFGAAELGVYLQKGSVNFTARYNSFKTDSQTVAWHLFPLELMLNATYQPINKLEVQAGVFVLNGAKGKLATGEEQKLKGVMDINLAARYNFTKNIGIFANLNNIAAVKAERFLYYPGYGFNALGGLLLRF